MKERKENPQTTNNAPEKLPGGFVQEYDNKDENMGASNQKGAGPGGGMRGGPRGGMHGAYGKPKNFKKAAGQLLGYIKKQIPLLILVLLLSAGTAAITIIATKKTSEIAGIIGKAFGVMPVDGQMQGVKLPVDMEAVKNIGVFLIIILCAGFVANFLKSFLMAGITHKIAKKFRTDIDTKINRLPLSYFDKRSYGDVLSRVTNDVDTISQNLNQSLTTLISTIVLLVGLIIMMFISSWQMALIAIATVPVSLIIIMITVKFSQKYFRISQHSLGELNGHIEETYSGHEVVRAYSGEEQVKRRFAKINGALYHTTWKGNFLSGLMFPVMNFVSNAGLAAICVFGGVMIARGSTSITVEVIVAFILYVRLFNNSLPQLAQVASSFQATAAAAERVFEFLQENEMESEKDKARVEIPDFKGMVEFKNVCFGYDSETKIIKNFSAVAMPGQKIAIVGPTGAGKTTLVNLLMRFYETDSGSITIDGVSTKDMTREQVRALFGMVLQDTWLFDGTIKENIIYAKQGVTDDEVVNACVSAGIDHVIRSLPNGYGMVLDDNVSLSAGQKQLVTIARAIVENAPMLILDEATSAVDTRTEILIQQAMDKLTEGRTSFIIAHRLSTIKNADLILVMRNGDIVEQGNHAQLMAQGGFYSELYASQFERV